MSVYTGNIDTSAPPSLAISLFFLHCDLTPPPLGCFPSLHPSHRNLVFPLCHSDVYSSKTSLLRFAYFFLILLVFVFYPLSRLKLPKTVKTEIAFPHMGLKQYIYIYIHTVALPQTLFDSCRSLPRVIRIETLAEAQNQHRFQFTSLAVLGHKTSYCARPPWCHKRDGWRVYPHRCCPVG